VEDPVLLTDLWAGAWTWPRLVADLVALAIAGGLGFYAGYWVGRLRESTVSPVDDLLYGRRRPTPPRPTDGW